MISPDSGPRDSDASVQKQSIPAQVRRPRGFALVTVLSLTVLLTLIIAAYTWRFLPDGVGNVFAVVPGIPTILLSRHFFKKAKD